MLCRNLSDIAIITVKGIDYRRIIHDINKFEVIDSVFDCCGYIQNEYQRNQY